MRIGGARAFATVAAALLAAVALASAEPPAPPKPPAGTKPAPPPKEPEKKAVVVAPGGGGDAKTLAEGLRLAGPGGRVRLKAGTYREPLEPAASCEVEGEGVAKDVVLEWELAPCVRVALEGEVTLRGVTLRGLGKDGTTPEAAAVVESGRLVLEKCVLAGSTSEGVLVRGEKARAVVRQCVVRASARGLRVEGGGAAEVQGGEMLGPGLVAGLVLDKGSTLRVLEAKVERWERGVEAGDGGEARLEAVSVSGCRELAGFAHSGGVLAALECTFRDGGGIGIRLVQGSTATFDACESTGHAKSGLVCEDGSSSVVWKGGRLGKNLGSGALVERQAVGTFEDVEVDANHINGIEVREQAKATVRRARIHDQTKGGAVVVHLQGEARVDEVETWGNTNDALNAFEAGVLDARGCKVRDSEATGVAVDSKGKLTLVDTEIWAHAGGGVSLGSGADALLQRVVVRDLKGRGVSVTGGAKGLLETCDVRGTADFGLWVQDAELVVRACRLRDGKQYGIGVGAGGKADVAGGEVTGHVEGGVYLATSGTAVVKDCKVKKNKGYGVRVQAGGNGTFEDNDLAGNAGGAWLLEEPSTVVRKGNKPNR